MKVYFDAIKRILSCSDEYAENWLDKNNKKLLGKATTVEDAKKEILNLFPKLKKISRKIK